MSIKTKHMLTVFTSSDPKRGCIFKGLYSAIFNLNQEWVLISRITILCSIENHTHMMKVDIPHNFFLAFTDELEKQLIFIKETEVGQ